MIQFKLMLSFFFFFLLELKSFSYTEKCCAVTFFLLFIAIEFHFFNNFMSIKSLTPVRENYYFFTITNCDLVRLYDFKKYTRRSNLSDIFVESVVNLN